MASTSTNPSTAEEKWELIQNNLQETLNPEIIKEILEKNERPLCIYWGTATTGRPHCGYFVPILKIAEFLRAGCRVKVLLADIHGFLDNLKAPIELVKFRAQYYKFVITELLKSVVGQAGVDKLEFVLGSSYQLSPEYCMDVYKISSAVTQHDARKAGSEVVKQVENSTLSSLIYPCMQALDEQYLGVDAQFGGVDQRKIFALAKEVLPKLGYKQRAHMMNPMVPGLQGGKMSASEVDSKIDLLDPEDAVRKKLKKAQAAPKVVEENGILSFVEYVLLPAGALKHGSPRFEVPRRDAEPLVYTDIAQMQTDYREDKLTPQTLKPAVAEALVELLKPIQEAFQASTEWQEIEKLAYPPPEAKKKKEKKDRGTRHPAVKAQEQMNGIAAKPDGHIESEKDDNKAAELNLGKDVSENLQQLKLEKEAVQDKA